MASTSDSIPLFHLTVLMFVGGAAAEPQELLPIGAR